MMIMMMMIVD